MDSATSYFILESHSNSSVWARDEDRGLDSDYGRESQQGVRPEAELRPWEGLESSRRRYQIRFEEKPKARRATCFFLC